MCMHLVPDHETQTCIFPPSILVKILLLCIYSMQQDKQIFACRLCSFSYGRSILSELLALVQFVPLHDHHSSEIVLLDIRHICLNCRAVICQSIFLLSVTQHGFGSYENGKWMWRTETW